MGEGFVVSGLEAAMTFAATIAKLHVVKGGDLVDLLATFVGMVVQENEAVGTLMPRDIRPMGMR
jgi:hypothetical protein